MLKWLKAKLSTVQAKNTIRLFLVTTFGLFVPGLLGWLNDLTAWARGQGATPFPDAHGLAYLGVSAITAGVVALIDLAWGVVQSGGMKAGLTTQKASQADPKADPKTNQAGALSVGEALLFVIAAILVIFLILDLAHVHAR